MEVLRKASELTKAIDSKYGVVEQGDDHAQVSAMQNMANLFTSPTPNNEPVVSAA